MEQAALLCPLRGNGSSEEPRSTEGRLPIAAPAGLPSSPRLPWPFSHPGVSAFLFAPVATGASYPCRLWVHLGASEVGGRGVFQFVLQPWLATPAWAGPMGSCSGGISPTT